MVKSFTIFIIFGVNALVVPLTFFHFVDWIEVFVEDLVFANILSDFLDVIHFLIVRIFQILV
jgi:hypothetical protein